jgi:hypothetical protein
MNKIETNNIIISQATYDALSKENDFGPTGNTCVKVLPMNLINFEITAEVLLLKSFHPKK